MFAVEYLPGQFDQRADSASECVQLISQGERPLVRSAKVYAIAGQLAPADVEAIKHYVINPVEAREASLEPRQTLKTVQPEPPMVEKLAGFLDLTDTQLQEFIDDRGLAMDLADIKFCQKYFAGEGRVPTITEIKMIDTYWSDHCRHTTFGTQLEQVKVDDQVVWDAFNQYLKMREELGRTKKPVCLMDMGTIGAKYLRAKGILKNLDESEEINACTIKCKVDVNGEQQDWLFLFKNETHNHPTEIEPFGGAATCIGGAIRDPLSGRSYVYQAMRVTGAGDPFTPVSQTMKGKLPQRQIVRTAAAGYSSYGNQIGLATGQVNELYHPGYVAKRMEIGAAPVATALAAQPAPPRPTTWSRWRRTARRSRRATPPRSASCSACSAAATPAASSSAATTLAQAASPLPLASWRTASSLTSTACPRSTRAWTARSWPSASPRSAWPWPWRRRTWTSSLATPTRRTLRPPSLPA